MAQEKIQSISAQVNTGFSFKKRLSYRIFLQYTWQKSVMNSYADDMYVYHDAQEMKCELN